MQTTPGIWTLTIEGTKPILQTTSKAGSFFESAKSLRSAKMKYYSILTESVMKFLPTVILPILFGCNQPENYTTKPESQHKLNGDTAAAKNFYKMGLRDFKNADHVDYHDISELISAKDCFEKAIGCGYFARDVFEKLSLCYVFLNDKPNTERVYSIGLEHFPKDMEFYFYRGNCRKELKNYQGAFIDYDEVVLHDTSKTYLKDAIYYRGAMSYILGNFRAADSDWNSAQKITNYELRTYPDYCQLWK